MKRIVALLVCAVPALVSAPRLKDEMRMPWTRSNERFIRRWLALTDIPLGAASAFERDWLAGGIKPAERMKHKLPDGSTVEWRALTAWGDATDLSDGKGLKRDVAGYAFATVTRKESGKALLSIGSDESIRVWVNGALVLDRRTPRQLTFDEDVVEVDMKAGENALLVKLEQRRGPWAFSARVLERGAIPPLIQEIGPSLMEFSDSALVVKTDTSKERADQDKVTVQVVGAGGRVWAEKIAARGDDVRFDAAAWPRGAYEIRCSTRKMSGLLYATHIAWYKGDAMAAARELVAAAKTAEFHTKMLADMVLERLGGDIGKVAGNPWWAIHSPLMEYEELKLEASGKTARERPYGFYRLAWRDDVDGSPQYCRAYLPGGYSRTKKWPLVVRLHGYNPENPDYVRWWSADVRHLISDVEYAGREGVIYMEPHGRGNTEYLGLGDRDVTRVVELAKQKFSVDEDRVYLVGESMGGWGAWNVATRHPDLFAAVAPIYGGADYHSQMSEDELAKLGALDRFLQEKGSSWAMAEGLLHLPILVTHGDADQSVNVEFSHYGVRMLERWGYNVRYVEMPGYGHEELNAWPAIIDWFLQYRRVSNPARVRFRSAELQNASAYWARVEQAASPREFMEVDAERTAPNTIRLDTRNVLAITLSPGPALVDAARPVKVVWNGDAREARIEGGKLTLNAPGYDRAGLEKTALAPGAAGDVLNTPFAIVAGTASPDSAMKAMCARKAEAAANFWRQWQHQPPRVFKDSDISDADAARYSLILIGGPAENAVARRFADKLPLGIAADHVTVSGRAFPVADARVQMIYPNPLNAQRYVLVVAGTSPTGLSLWMPERLRNAEPDFTIEDCRIAAGNQPVSPRELWVAGGWFDHRWQLRDYLVFPGNADARAKAVLIQPALAIGGAVLDSYIGGYEIAPGTVVKVSRTENRLSLRVAQQPAMELLPISESEFVIVEGPVKLRFEKDAAGKVTALKAWPGGGRELAAKKVE